MIAVNEATEILGISRRRFYRLVERRSVPHVKLGGCVRFEKGMLIEWVRIR